MTTATIRVMAAEEIAARAGGSTPFLQLPPATVFAERAMRLRQRAAGHAMGDFLRFVADIALAQQQQLAAASSSPLLPLPDGAQLDAAAADGVPPLPATAWPRGTAWHGVLRAIAAAVQPGAPAAARAALAALATADAERLEQQADTLLHGATAGLDLAQAPLVAAALQVAFTQLLQRTHAEHANAFGRTDNPFACPCCGSRPVASITKSGGELMGQRYLHCSLCSLQWNLPRAQCTHCGSTKTIAYEALDAADAVGAEAPSGTEAPPRAEARPDGGARAARAAVQAETCDDCGHYLKFLHSERDPFVEPVADDLASLTLDLLVSDSGKRRHGVNLMLLFGDPPDPPDAP